MLLLIMIWKRKIFQELDYCQVNCQLCLCDPSCYFCTQMKTTGEHLAISLIAKKCLEMSFGVFGV